jgi:hypothetical protein
MIDIDIIVLGRFSSQLKSPLCIQYRIKSKVKSASLIPHERSRAVWFWPLCTHVVRGGKKSDDRGSRSLWTTRHARVQPNGLALCPLGKAVDVVATAPAFIPAPQQHFFVYKYSAGSIRFHCVERGPKNWPVSMEMGKTNGALYSSLYRCHI